MGLWLDGSTIILFACFGETESQPAFLVSITAFCKYAGLGVLLYTLMLITMTKRTYLMNGYEVINFHAPSSPHFVKTGQGVLPLTL